MGCIVSAGSIKHIDHLYQPSDDFLNATYETIKVFQDMFNGGVEWKWTHKIDDQVSLKIRRLNGVYAVGYKGNSKFVTNFPDITKEYPGHLHQPLLVLLLNARSIIPTHFIGDVEYQVGILGHYIEDYCNGFITPNVVDYIVHHPQVQRLNLIVSIASISDLDNEGNRLNISQDINFDYMKPESNVLIIDNTIKLPKFSKEFKEEFIVKMDQLKTMFSYRQSFLDRKDYILKINTIMRKYINHTIRENLRQSFIVFISYLIETINKEVDAVKMETTKATKSKNNQDFINFIGEHELEVNNIFGMQQYLRKISDMILNELGTCNCKSLTAKSIDEGFVVSKPVGNDLVMFKIVHTAFSKRNFDEHSNRSIR